jgi:hypothetical protein
MADDDRVSFAWVRHMTEERAAEPVEEPMTPQATMATLDALRAAEGASAAVFEAWRSACALDGLRGGLRTITARESAHATLLESRLKELGAAPRSNVAPEALVQAVERYGDAAVPDDVKLDEMLARRPDGAEVARRIAAAGVAASDPETGAMLGLVAGGEQATIAWLRAYRRTVAGPLTLIGP